MSDQRERVGEERDPAKPEGSGSNACQPAGMAGCFCKGVGVILPLCE